MIYIYIYSYIDGKSYRITSSEQVNKLFEMINNVNKIEFNKSFNKNNIFKKYDKYKQYLISNAKDFSKIVNKIMLYDKKYVSKIDKSKYYIAHGDLCFKNIIWKNNNPFLIDFDECCLAPKEYDYANFLIKNCFINNKFNIKLARKIINVARNYNIDIDNLKNNIYFYIIKVLIEKLYYHLLFGLNIECEDQKKDYWLWWYNLLINDKIIESLFTDN